MKTLTIIRHAKSSWHISGIDDFDRPLNHRGRRDAPRMGNHLSRRGLRPDCFLSSPANRAIYTAKAIARALDFPQADILEHPELYEADVTDLVEVLRKTDPGRCHVVLVAHNPGCSDLVRYVTGEDIDSLPTCAAAHTSVITEPWATLSAGCASLVYLDVPRSIPD